MATSPTQQPADRNESPGGDERLLEGAVVAVAGAGGPAGQAALLRLAQAGAVVAAADTDASRLAQGVDAARFAHGGATVVGDTVDLLDLAATREWAERTRKEFGRVDGLVHLVGGWRGGAGLDESSLDHWDALFPPLVRTVQHTSIAFQDALLHSGGRGRYLFVSAAGATRPTAGNAAYAAAKSAAEAWTLALAHAFRKAGTPEEGPPAAAAILVVKALVHDAMRAERPQAKFAGFTDVSELAEAVVDVWRRPAEEVNGNRLWLTPKA